MSGRVLLIIFLLTLNVSCEGQSEKFITAKEFISKILDDNKATDNIIIRNYISIDNPTKEYVDFLKVELNLFRQFLKNEVSDDRLITFGNYDSTIDSDLILSDNEKENVVMVFYKDKYLIPLLVKSKKISSFCTMSKGGKKVFVLL